MVSFKCPYFQKRESLICKSALSVLLLMQHPVNKGLQSARIFLLKEVLAFCHGEIDKVSKKYGR